MREDVGEMQEGAEAAGELRAEAAGELVFPGGTLSEGSGVREVEMPVDAEAAGEMREGAEAVGQLISPGVASEGSGVQEEKPDTSEETGAVTERDTVTTQQPYSPSSAPGLVQLPALNTD